MSLPRSLPIHFISLPQPIREQHSEYVVDLRYDKQLVEPVSKKHTFHSGRRTIAF